MLHLERKVWRRWSIISVERKRKTVQQQVILDTLKSFTTHPTVDELYCEIQKKHPAISKTTIYRNLRNLSSDGTILQVPLIEDVSRYDSCVNPHSHFFCNECGTIYDVDISSEGCLTDASNFVEGKYGYKITRQEISLFGICSKCAENSG